MATPPPPPPPPPPPKNDRIRQPGKIRQRPRLLPQQQPMDRRLDPGPRQARSHQIQLRRLLPSSSRSTPKPPNGSPSAQTSSSPSTAPPTKSPINPPPSVLIHPSSFLKLHLGTHLSGKLHFRLFRSLPSFCRPSSFILHPSALSVFCFQFSAFLHHLPLQILRYRRELFASAACKSSAISAAMISGAGRFAESSNASSFSQKMSRFTLSRFNSSS